VIRQGVAAHQHILADHGGPDAFSTTIWTVFATRGAEQRIKRFLAIPGHLDLKQVAKHLGIRKAILANQISLLERDVGVPLLETAPGPDGIRLTPAGEKFTQEALPVWPYSIEQATTPVIGPASCTSTAPVSRNHRRQFEADLGDIAVRQRRNRRSRKIDVTAVRTYRL
jgi:hypothetical protein